MPVEAGGLQYLIQDELNASERLLWSAQPRPSRLARKSLPLVLFGIPWTAFALFWTAGASGFKMPDFHHVENLFPLFGLPFILIGLGLLTSPFWIMRKARSTVYGLTTERIIIISPKLFGGINIRSLPPDQLTDINRVQLADGSGDVILHRDITPNSKGGNNVSEVGFFGIQNAKEVEQLVLALSAKK
jgi:hypothetical protein